MERQPISREGYDKLREEVRRLEEVDMPAIAERILKLGIEPQPLSVAAFGELLRVEAERTARVIKISGAKAE